MAVAGGEFSPWVWPVFGIFMLVMLGLDLGLGQLRERTLTFKEALVRSGLWIALALVFALGLALWRQREVGAVFIGGYLLELSLSVDNLFLFILIFAYFKIPEAKQQRVLFWGVLGAVVMRAIFIIVGVAAVDRFAFLIPLFGALLLITGVKFLWPSGSADSEVWQGSFWVDALKRALPMTSELQGNAFWVRVEGRWRFTPLFLVLLVIEGTDLIFAIDSVPAVLGILPPEMSVEERRFVAFSSNLFAIMGLRSLYFALVGLERYSRFLKPALAVILLFIGLKMVLPAIATWAQPEDQVAAWVPGFCFHHGKVGFSTEFSLSFIGITLLVAILASAIFPAKK